MTSHNFEITDNAVSRIKELATQSGDGKNCFRITVLGGGCSGFQYKFDMDSKISDKDIVFERCGVSVVIDDLSIGFLENSKLDFIEDLGSAAFEIKNPNATAKCGCGNSFSV